MKTNTLLLLGIIFCLLSCKNEAEDAEAITLTEVENKKDTPRLTEYVPNDYSQTEPLALREFSIAKNNFKNQTTQSGKFYRIAIGNLLSTKDLFAMLMYFTSDTSAVVMIHQYKSNEWISVYKQTLEIWEDLNDFEMLRFEDFTGDDIKEIILPRSISPSHSNHDFYCFRFNGSTFTLIDGFEELTNPQFERKTQTIHTMHGGGYGQYVAQEYKLMNNKVVEFKKTESYLLSKGRADADYTQVIKTYATRKNGESLIKTDSIKGFSSEKPPFWKAYYAKENEN